MIFWPLLLIICLIPEYSYGSDLNTDQIVEQLRLQQQFRNSGPRMPNFGEKCVFRCGKGKKAVQKNGYKPKNYGCNVPTMGIQGMNMDMYNINFATCCNQQSACFGICGKSKESCDEELQLCFDKWCDVNERGVEKCLLRAKEISGLTRMFNCDLYKEAQKSTCKCVREEF